MQQKQKLVNRLMKGSCLDMFGLLNLRIANIAMSQCKIRWISHMMVVNPPQGICESSRHLRIHMTYFMDDEGLHMAQPLARSLVMVTHSNHGKSVTIVFFPIL